MTNVERGNTPAATWSAHREDASREIDARSLSFLSRTVDLIKAALETRDAGILRFGTDADRPSDMVGRAPRDVLAAVLGGGGSCAVELGDRILHVACAEDEGGGHPLWVWALGPGQSEPQQRSQARALLADHASQAADFLQQRRLIASADEACRRQAFASGLLEELRGLDSPAAIEQVALSALTRSFNADRIGLGLIDATGRHAEFEFVDISGVELLTGEFPVAAFGIDPSARRFPQVVQFPAANAMTIPVVRRRRLEAVVHLYRSAALGAWNSADAEFAAVLVDKVWSERARASAGAALQDSEARLRTVLEGVTDAFFVIDKSWRFVVFNHAAETFFQLKRQDVLGRRLSDVIPAAKGSVFEQCFSRVMAHARSETFSGPSAFSPGRHVQCRVYPQAGGGVAASFTDDTEQRRLDLALKDREAHLTALYDQSGVGLAETDMDGRFINANSEFCRILGRSLGDVLRLRMSDVTHAGDLRASHGLINRLMTGVGVFSIQKRYVRPDGSVCHVSNTVSLIRHASKPTTTLVVAIDISDLRAAEAALLSPESVFLNRQPVGVAPFAKADPDGLFTAVTPSFCDLIGRSERDMLGSSVLEITHPDDVEAFEGLYSRMREAGEPFQVDQRLVRPDGRVVWLKSSGGVLPGARRGAIVIAQDRRFGPDASKVFAHA